MPPKDKFLFSVCSQRLDSKSVFCGASILAFWLSSSMQNLPTKKEGNPYGLIEHI